MFLLFLLQFFSRIVHGKNRQHQSLILNNLKLKQKGEEKQLHGQILMEVMNYSLDLDQMERCKLVGPKPKHEQAKEKQFCVKRKRLALIQ